MDNDYKYGRRYSPVISKKKTMRNVGLKNPNLSAINESMNEQDQTIASKGKVKEGIREDLVKLRQAKHQVENLTQFFKVHCHPHQGKPEMKE